MGVDQVIPVVLVPGQVELHHAVDWYCVQKFIGRKAMIEGADINIVDIQ